MRRRYVLLALAAVAVISMSMPAFGAPSPLNVAQRAITKSKKATKAARTANRRARRALRNATAAQALAQSAANAAGQALAVINSPEGVPRAVRAQTAGRADTAGLADSATTALNADNATNATNADSAAQLSGLTRVDELLRVGATNGADVAAARAAAPEQPLGESGPFEFYGKCFNDQITPEVYGEIYVRSAVDGALLDGQSDTLEGDPDFLDDDTAEDDRQVEVVSNSTPNSATIELDEDISGIVTPEGALHQVQVFLAVKHGNLAGGNGIYGSGNACLLGLQILR